MSEKFYRNYVLIPFSDKSCYNIHMKVKYKKILSMVLTVACVSISAGSYSIAEENTLYDDVTRATELLEERIEKSYENALNEIEKVIKEKNLDYELTMLTAANVENLSSQIDYTGLIAAGASIKTYKNETSVIESGFITPEIEVKTLKEKEPVKKPVYEENADGFYTLVDYVYLSEDETDYEYRQIEEGVYERTGVMKDYVLPEIDTLYGEVTFHIMTPEELLKLHGMDSEKCLKDYEKRKRIIESEISNETLNQQVFIQKEYYSMDAETVEYINSLLERLDGEQRLIVNTATSLIGRVPYQWGGKASAPGIDLSWWTYDESGIQKGLDCSGYVSWVFRTAGYPEEVYKKLNSTSTCLSLTEISKDELEVGDIGLLNRGETTNHVGIYLGDGKWIHCSSGAGTVVVNNFNFTIFKRIEEKTEQVSTQGENTVQIEAAISEYTQDDVYLLAQTISHEAKGEGYNGWVAAGEVVINRVYSDRFPDTVKEVVYQDGQFSHSENIKYETPRQEIVQVAEMLLGNQIRYYNNPYVLYFRNAQGNMSDWGNAKFYDVVNRHTFYIQEEND